MNNKIVLNFKNIASDLENKELKLCLLSKNRSWVVEDNQNNMYQIESDRYGSYLDKLIKEGITVTFNLVDSAISKNIGDWEKEIWGVSKVKDFMLRQHL